MFFFPKDKLMKDEKIKQHLDQLIGIHQPYIWMAINRKQDGEIILQCYEIEKKENDNCALCDISVKPSATQHRQYISNR